jgi:hypothetical protein
MTIMIADHQLNDFDQWFALFSANPPPSYGTWRLLRGADDPNRVYVIGEVRETDVDDVNAFFQSERMAAVLDEANAMSARPMEIVWLNDVTPG